MWFLVLVFLLAGCGNGPPAPADYPYENVEISNFSQLIYFRNFRIASGFNNRRIPLYKNGVVTFSDSYKWGVKLKDHFLNHLVLAGRVYKIKFTNMSNFNFLDCMIDEIFYDCERRQMVMNCTVNFNGNISTFYIKRSINGPKEFDRAFAFAASYIAKFVTTCQNNKIPKSI